MAASRAELERELDRLYQLPLSEFTSARNELAKRLRSEGESDKAEEVKKLRKPAAAVWLVNRLARERELDVQRLLKAGESLANTAGDSSDAFLTARHDEHRALERLARAARELASREGIGGSSVDKATETLRAASLSDEGRELLKRGRLTEELQPPGFEALQGVPKAAPLKVQKPSAMPKDGRAERRRAEKELRKRLRQLRAEERDLSAAARSAERDAQRAEKEASGLRKAADIAAADAGAAGERVAAAERKLQSMS